MSVDTVKGAIQRFLASPDPEILVISGPWGVGKTFTWNAVLQAAKGAGTIALQRYSYVSLFGLATLDDVRSAIFANTVKREAIGDVTSFASLKASMSGAEAGGRWLFNLAKEIPWVKDNLGDVSKLSALAINKQIVCFDDLERIAGELDTKLLLGLASHLKDQRRCKVVILLNREKLEPDARKEFDIQLEKVADIALDYAPTAPEAAGIALATVTEVSECLKQHAADLGIVNIRVIKKAEKFALEAAELLNGIDGRVMDRAIQSIALMAFAKFQPDTAPSINFLKSLAAGDIYGVPAVDDAESPWRELLSSYGFTNMDEFDHAVLRGIELGTLNNAVFMTASKDLAANLVLQDQGEGFEAAWALYHDSFADNKAEVVATMVQSFQNGVATISPINASRTVSMLRELGHDAEADQLITTFVAQEREQTFWNLDDHPFGDEVKDAAFRAAIDERFVSFEPTMTYTERLIDLGKRSSWGTADLVHLATATPADFYDVFKSLTGEDLNAARKAALRFARHQVDEHHKTIAAAAKEALGWIGAESAINARRVARYGITPKARPAD